MASGRFLHRKISSNKDLPRLISLLSERMGEPHGSMAALLFTWCIAHLDVEGRMHGDPHVVKGAVVPRISFMTPELIKVYLEAMHEIGLVVYYQANDDVWLCFPSFETYQVGLRKNKEPKSGIPAPAENDVRTTAGTLPDDCRTSSANVPAQEKGREEKGSYIYTREAVPLAQRWLQTVGNLGQGSTPLSTVWDACEQAALALDPPRDPDTYFADALVAFCEWVDGCPPDRRPQKSPLKFMDHFARVHEIVIGKRKAVPPPTSGLPQKHEPTRPPLMSPDELRKRRAAGGAG